MSNTFITCTHCSLSQSESEYSVKDKKTGRRNRKCKTCQRAYSASHYNANPQLYIDKAAVHNKAYRARNSLYVQETLNSRKCSCCGTVNDLSYYLPGPSLAQPVHQAVASSLSIETVKEAIDRSIVLCGECLGSTRHDKGRGKWGEMSQEERDVVLDEQFVNNLAAPEKGRFKNYRRKSVEPTQSRVVASTDADLILAGDDAPETI